MPFPKDPIKREEYLTKIRAFNKTKIGKPMSEATKQKISNTIKLAWKDHIKAKRMNNNNPRSKGIVWTAEQIQKRADGNRGKKRSKQACLNISNSKIGLKHSEETKRKLSIIKKGDKSHYIVGDNRFYAPDTRIGETNWKNTIKERDQFTCQLCELILTPGELHAHHIYSFVEYPEKRLDINNGMTLCAKCHKMVHKANTLIK